MGMVASGLPRIAGYRSPGGSCQWREWVRRGACGGTTARDGRSRASSASAGCSRCPEPLRLRSVRVCVSTLPGTSDREDWLSSPASAGPGARSRCNGRSAGTMVHDRARPGRSSRPVRPDLDHHISGEVHPRPRDRPRAPAVTRERVRVARPVKRRAAVLVSPRAQVVAASTVRSAPAADQPGQISHSGGNQLAVGQVVAVGRAVTPDGYLGRHGGGERRGDKRRLDRARHA